MAGWKHAAVPSSVQSRAMVKHFSLKTPKVLRFSYPAQKLRLMDSVTQQTFQRQSLSIVHAYTIIVFFLLV